MKTLLFMLLLIGTSASAQILGTDTSYRLDTTKSKYVLAGSKYDTAYISYMLRKPPAKYDTLPAKFVVVAEKTTGLLKRIPVESIVRKSTVVGQKIEYYYTNGKVIKRLYDIIWK